MEAPNRDQEEYELAAAILLLWLLFENTRAPSFTYDAFLGQFNDRVRPILTRVYGRARVSLADEFGLSYQTRTAPGGGTVIQLPGLDTAIDRYAREIYESMKWRIEGREQARTTGEEPPELTEAGASTIAVSTITDVNSAGELDGAQDVETRVGTRIQAVWRTELNPCPICAPLDGTTTLWRRLFPRGPKAHPNCILPSTLIAFPFDCYAAMRSQYSGLAYRIETSQGICELTAGHKIPIKSGESKAAEKISVGDKLLTVPKLPYQESAEGTFEAAWSCDDFPKAIVPVQPGYFHGEGKSMRGSVEVSFLGRMKTAPENHLANQLSSGSGMLQGLPSAEVLSVEEFEYAGPVYDFSGSVAAYYLAGGIFVHNCRCWLEWRAFGSS